jgi:hypothetical protein
VLPDSQSPKRGGDKVLCTFAVLGTGQYCSVFEFIPLVMFLTQTHLRDEPGSAKAGMIIIESDDKAHIQRENVWVSPYRHHNVPLAVGAG